MRDSRQMPRKHWLEHRVPPPALALLAVVVQRRLPRREPGSARRVVASVAAVSSVALVADAERQMHRRHTTFDPFTPSRASSLVSQGSFGLTRNPMYLAMAGIIAAHGVLRGHPAQVLPLAAWVGFIDRFQVRPEEQALCGNFGEDYAAYRRRVRRWV